MKRTDPDVFEVNSHAALPAEPGRIIAALSAAITPERFARIASVAANRVHTVTTVLEDIADPHNASAILRSCDAFGVQELHAIELRHRFLASKVARGTQNWIDVNRHSSSEACIAALKQRGFRVCLAVMEGDKTPDDLRQFDKVAVVFGNEHNGASSNMRELTDETFRVPMYGFVESLNVSVAAAVTLYTVTRGRQGKLQDAEKERVLAELLYRSVADADAILARS